MGRFTGVLGMAVILGLAWVFSTNRRAIKLKTIAWGLGLQLALGFFVLRSGVGSSVFGFLGAGANKLLSFSYAGSTFVFGCSGSVPRRWRSPWCDRRLRQSLRPRTWLDLEASR